MHKAAIGYVAAAAQARAAVAIMPELTDEEKAYFRRGKNAPTTSMPQHASLADYKAATGLEAVIGFLYLQGASERLYRVLGRIMDILDAGDVKGDN